MNRNTVLTITLASLVLCSTVQASDAPTTTATDPMASCPMHAQHMADAKKAAESTAHADHDHAASVDMHHDTFGMSHESTTHSFRLFADGGAIELRANDTADEATVHAIRTHLEKVTKQFQANDFSTPAFVHGAKPDGVTTMERLHGHIAYRFEPLPGGGRIRMTAKGAEALTATHDFLKFQIVEHRTRNSGEVEADR